MNLNSAYSEIRKLAKSSDSQTIYSNAKELHFQLFKNNSDLTSVQLMYLRFLNFYATIYLDIYLQEVDELVLKDEIYEDAYMLFRDKNKNKMPIPNQEIEQQTPVKSQWVFKQPKAKRTF